jgi:hypothetical protein
MVQAGEHRRSTRVSLEAYGSWKFSALYRSRVKLSKKPNVFASAYEHRVNP